MCLERYKSQQGLTFLSTYYVTGTVPRALHSLVHVALQYSCEVGTISVFILQKKKLKHRGISCLPKTIQLV